MCSAVHSTGILCVAPKCASAERRNKKCFVKVLVYNILRAQVQTRWRKKTHILPLRTFDNFISCAFAFTVSVFTVHSFHCCLQHFSRLKCGKKRLDFKKIIYLKKNTHNAHMLKLWKSSLNQIELRPQWKVGTQQMQGNLHKSPFAYNTSFRFGSVFWGKMTTHWFHVWHFSFIRWFFVIICSFFTPCTGFPHDGYYDGVR